MTRRELIEMELVHRDGLARIGKFKTKHGVIETPTVLPVINPNKITITPEEMKSLGAQGIITNSYIIRRTDALREKALKDGVHSLVSFDGPIMTDSGTFQSYVYGDMEYDNRGIVDFQRKIGSDIITILDIFSKPDDTYGMARDAVDETYSRMREIEVGDGEIIAGPVQGSVYQDLREKAARLMSSSDAGYLPVGGVVPLLESYQYDKLVDIVLTARMNSDFSKPIHLFGGGHPMFLAISVLLGVDFFDSASYVKYARDGRMLYPDGTRDLVKLRTLPRWSPIYGKYTVKELLDAESEERTAALSRH
ncbi:MAG TPA: tRNA guanosine(15) transglycosylase TgtA, partial [Thermoplasmataceae archaeon]|nr:tRNA guanosine(15) transglycosylase TgtA [Thermoplasmataceae archaeon]